MIMTRRYSLVIEGDESGYSGYVPELSTTLVTGQGDRPRMAASNHIASLKAIKI